MRWLFFPCHPYIWSTTVFHDNNCIIFLIHKVVTIHVLGTMHARIIDTYVFYLLANHWKSMSNVIASYVCPLLLSVPTCQPVVSELKMSLGSGWMGT